MIKTVLSAVLTAAIITAGCSQTTSGMFSGERTQLMLVSSETVNSKAALAYEEVLDEAQERGILNVDEQQTMRVRAVADRLISAAPRLRPDCATWDWEVNVLTDDTVNAWCMAGGKICVYTGIIDTLELTDDELAVIIGHEMSHALREHTREQASQAAIKQGALSIASLLGVDSAALMAGSILADVGVLLPFSRRHETEADEMGLELMYLAGYDVDSGAAVWRKMQSINSGAPVELLSTHPSSDSRIANLEKMAFNLKTFGKSGG